MSDGSPKHIRLATEADADRSLSVKETIDDFRAYEASSCDFVVILAIGKNGSQFMRTSTGSMYEKSFLLAFFQAFMSKWFGIQLGE